MQGGSTVCAWIVRFELKPTECNAKPPLALVVVERTAPACRIETVAFGMGCRVLEFRTAPLTAPI